MKSRLKDVLKAVPGAKWLVRRVRSYVGHQPADMQGPKGIEALGHQVYVGGLWEEIGKLQFDFLVSEGLRPHHHMLDIACGSLRAGIHFIPYLERGHYLGIEKEEGLIRAGIENELGTERYIDKKPEFVISSHFEFLKFTSRPDYALAQSLFTHLTTPLIKECFSKLRKVITERGVFYATFNEVPSEVINPDEPHDHALFWYTRQQMVDFGSEANWRGEYVGDWGHPRNQKMMRYRPVL